MTAFDRLALALIGTALIAAAVAYLRWRWRAWRRLGTDPTDRAGV